MHLKPDLSGVDDLTVNLTQRVCIGDVPTRAAAMYRDRVAIMDGDTETTYCQLEERSNALARGLRAEGFERGDAIGLLMMNRWEFVVSFFACAKIGDVPAKGWTDQFAKDTSRVEVLVEDRDIRCCLYTLGTTSRPKGVLTSHVAVQIAALTSAVTIGSRPGTEPGTQVIEKPTMNRHQARSTCGGAR